MPFASVRAPLSTLRPSGWGIPELAYSALSGRAALQEKMRAVLPSLTKDSPQVAAVLARVKAAEGRGYQYEDAEASLMLLIYAGLGLRRDVRGRDL